MGDGPCHVLIEIEADRSQIEQVLLNLYVNAADAMEGNGKLILVTMNATHKDMQGRGPASPCKGDRCVKERVMGPMR
jgi:nitrogen-specific signal transduction histidine kinase